jgi:hypothetical protein
LLLQTLLFNHSAKDKYDTSASHLFMMCLTKYQDNFILQIIYSETWLVCLINYQDNFTLQVIYSETWLVWNSKFHDISDFS